MPDNTNSLSEVFYNVLSGFITCPDSSKEQVILQLHSSDFYLSVLYAVIVIAVGIIVAFWLGKILVRYAVLPFGKRIRRIVRELSSPIGFVIGIIIISAGLAQLNSAFGSSVCVGGQSQALDGIIASLYIIAVFWFVVNLLPTLVSHINKKSEKVNDLMEDWILKVSKAVIWILCVVTVIESWGISVAPVLAGLSLAGAALAISAQDFVKSVIAGMIIAGEGKINLGSYVEVGGIEGIVESMGLRATDIRHIDDSLNTLPNSTLISSNIRNHSLIKNRLFKTILGIEYSAKTSQLVEVRDNIEKLLKNHQDIAQDRKISVKLSDFGSSSIDIEVIAYLTTGDMNSLRRCKDDLMQKIRKIVEDAGVGFAFPSQTVYVRK